MFRAMPPYPNPHPQTIMTSSIFPIPSNSILLIDDACNKNVAGAQRVAVAVLSFSQNEEHDFIQTLKNDPTTLMEGLFYCTKNISDQTQFNSPIFVEMYCGFPYNSITFFTIYLTMKIVYRDSRRIAMVCCVVLRTAQS